MVNIDVSSIGDNYYYDNIKYLPEKENLKYKI